MSIGALFLIIALICFVLASIPVIPSRVNLLAVGLAFWTAAELLGTGVVHR